MVRRVALLGSAILAGAMAGPGMVSGARAAGPRVLVIPFSTLNLPDDQQWIGRAVGEDIIADFGHAGGYSPVAFQGQLLVEDNATAISLAHKADSDLVIRGAAQKVDKSLRITAQFIDARSGDTVATASVTGAATDLLKLEDGLSSQLLTNVSAAAQQAQQQSRQMQTATQQPMADANSGITYTPNPAYATPAYVTPAYAAPTYAVPTYTPGYSYPPTYAPTYYDNGYNGFSSPYYDYGYTPSLFIGGGFGYGLGYGGGYYGGRYFGGHDRDDGFRGGSWNGRGGGFHGGGIGGDRDGFGGGFHGGGMGGHAGGIGGSRGGGGHR